jgi:phage gpG-like protein
MTVTVKITGLDRFDAALSRMQAATRSARILQALQAGAYIIMAYAQDNARRLLNRHPTGYLTNSMGVRVVGKTVMVGVWGVVYAKIHEFGGVITPIKAKALHFKVGGRWVTTKRVLMPARPYLRPAVWEHEAEINQAIGDTMAGIINEAANG